MEIRYLIFLVLAMLWGITSFYFAKGGEREQSSFVHGWLVGTVTFWTVISIYFLANYIAGGILLCS